MLRTSLYPTEQSICWVSVLKLRKVAMIMAFMRRMPRKGRHVKVSFSCRRKGARFASPCSALRLGGVGGFDLWPRAVLSGPCNCTPA